MLPYCLAMENSANQQKTFDDDVATLQAMGYRQELLRRMSGFSNYAISLSIICILAGGITSFQLALCATGGAGVTFGWPLMSLIALAFAATMGQVASAFPTAGGLYHWAAILGGNGWGWVTAWFNLAGLITVLAAINVGTFEFCIGSLGVILGPEFTEQIAASKPFWQLGIVLAITVSQAYFNHRGIRVTTWLTDFNGYLILVAALALTAALVWFAPRWDFAQLVTFTNYSGLPEGESPVWPRQDSLGLLFALGLMLPAYTITGFDASAHTSEETLGAARTVPKSIVRAVWVSGLFGWIMLMAVVLAIPDMDAAVAQGGNAFYWTVDQVLPKPLAIVLLASIAVAQYICGLATVTSASRMIFAFARDGGLPFSKTLRRVSTAHQTPDAAIWTAALLSVAFTVFTPVYSTITTVCVIFLYISYVIPTFLGLLAYGNRWTVMGPWSLGRWYRPLAAVCLLGGIGIYLIGVQPPNDKALWITIGACVLLAVIWFAFTRRTFSGPPHIKRL
ncbi:amino acid permease [soil metagenome]